MESFVNPTVFERNPVKTIISVVLIIIITLDVAAARFLLMDSQGIRYFQMLNEKIAYKLQVHQHRKANLYYHHDLAPDQNIIEKWGPLQYRLITNSWGFKDSFMRDIQPDSHKKRILFLGDSFTEGFGMPYEKTFVGMVDKRVDHEKYEILNAAVVSYSPKLYYYKTKYLLEYKHLKIDELFVFIDVSDIFNELEYEIFDPKDLHSNIFINVFDKISGFLENYSFLYNFSRYFFIQSQNKKKLSFLDYVVKNKHNANFWTLNETLFKEWGGKGVHLAEKHMQMLVDLCKTHGIKMTIAVYPYDSEIYYGNRDSKQIRIWRYFSESNRINFINYYPDFFDAPFLGIPNSKANPYYILSTYFIPGDPHWNENGHRLIANKLPIP